MVGYPDWVEGSHLDDVFSILGPTFMEVFRRIYLRHDYSAVDKKISDLIMDYYSNFAHTGNPNEGPFKPNVRWNEFNTEKQDFLLESENFTMKSFYDDNMVDRYRFWTDIFPTIPIYPPPPTFPPVNHVNSEFGRVQATRKKYTERDVLNAVNKFKHHLQMMTRDKHVWQLIDDQIDYFVSSRPKSLPF